MTVTGVLDEPTGLIVSSLRDLDLAIDRVRTAFAHRYHVTINDGLVVSHLAANGHRLRPGEIAAELMVTSGTLTPMLDRLEAAKFVRREPNPDDRRSVIVVLTDFGLRALDEYREQFGTAIDNAIPASVRRQVAQWLGDVAGALHGLSVELQPRDAAPR